jgi:regulation of enolase protein 1 (concanavalin A-like superfamily)
MAVIGDPIRISSQPEGSSNGDTFNSTWMPDGSTLITQDDSSGFAQDSYSASGGMNLGLAKLYGDPSDPRSLRGVDYNPGRLGTSLYTTYGAALGPDKNSGLYSVDGVLYMAQVNYGGTTGTVLNLGYVNLIKSTDGGITWINAQGATNTKPTSGLSNSMFPDVKWRYADFIQYGKDGYAPKTDRADEFVYMWTYDTSKTSTQSDNSRNADYMWLARVSRSRIANLDKADIQYYTGGDGNSDANWSSSPSASASIRTDPGQATGGSIAYNATLRRYVMSQFHGLAGTDNRSEQYLLESAHPWGPWTMVDDHMFPTNDIYPPLLFDQAQTSQNGTTMWGLTSDSFAVGSRYGLHETPVYLSTSPVSTVEGESATLSGGATTGSSVAGYTGTGYAHIGSSGQAVTFSVSPAAAGSYIVNFRYHQNQSTDQRVSVFVNGAKQGSYKLSNSEFYGKTWSQFGKVLNLASGSNTIQLKYDTNDSANVDIDNVKVAFYSSSDAGGGIATYSAGSSSLGGSATLSTTNAEFNSTGYAAFSSASDSAQWTVTAPTAGYYKLTTRYANGAGATDNSVDLYVNGTKFTSLTLPTTLTWDTYEPSVETVYLAAGSNTLRYANTAATVVQVNSVTLAPLSSATTTYVDDSDTAKISYSGTWTADTAQTGFVKDTLHYSQTTASTAQMTFSGTAVRVLGDFNNNHGTTKVYIDGTLDSTIDTFEGANNAPIRGQVIYSKSGLTDASHTIKLEVTGTKNTSASGYFTSIDGFAYDAGHTDDFTDSQPDPAWTPVREDDANWSLTDSTGTMRLATTGTELWQGINTLKNVWLRNAQGSDWTISTKLTFNPTTDYQQAGLIAYQDDDDYVRVMSRLNPGGSHQVDTEKEASQVGTFTLVANSLNPIYLRLVKSGTTYTSYYSSDGVTWTLATQYTGVSLTNPKVGLIAAGPSGVNADFDWFDQQ